MLRSSATLSMFRTTQPCMANLKVFKDKTILYAKLGKIIATLKSVTLAKYTKAQLRIPYRCQSVKYTKKVFGLCGPTPAIVPDQETLTMAITTQRGKCGALNSRQTKHINDLVNEGFKTSVIVTGKMGVESMPRNFPKAIVSMASFETQADVPLACLYTLLALEHPAQRIRILFTRFGSLAVQEYTQLVLPSFEWWKAGAEAATTAGDAPKGQTNNARLAVALRELSEEAQQDFFDFHLMLAINVAMQENSLAELGARLAAVENQLQNVTKLQLWAQATYNKTRQANVTAEMLELCNTKTAMDEVFRLEEEKIKAAKSAGKSLVDADVKAGWISSLQARVKGLRMDRILTSNVAVATTLGEKISALENELTVLKAPSWEASGMSEAQYIDFIVGYGERCMVADKEARYEAILAEVGGAPAPASAEKKKKASA